MTERHTVEVPVAWPDEADPGVCANCGIAVHQANDGTWLHTCVGWPVCSLRMLERKREDGG